MMQIVWTPLASGRLVYLASFLVDKAPDAAAAIINRIRESIHKLSTHPRLGRLVPELVAEEREYREMCIQFGSAGYLVLYQIARDQVIILNLKHQREAGWVDQATGKTITTKRLQRELVISQFSG